MVRGLQSMLPMKIVIPEYRFRLLLGQLHLQKCLYSSHQHYGKSGNYYNFKTKVVLTGITTGVSSLGVRQQDREG